MNCRRKLGRVSFPQPTWTSGLHCQGAEWHHCPQSTAPGLAGSSSTLSWSLFLTATALCDPPESLELFTAPSLGGLGLSSCTHSSKGQFLGALKEFYFSICMKFFPVRSKAVIVSACAGTIPGLFLLSVLGLEFLSQHCHNWCTSLEAEESIVFSPSPQCLQGLGTECLPPAETHSTHQHHFMGLYLPLSVHKSVCQVLLLGWGWSSPGGWPCSP